MSAEDNFGRFEAVMADKYPEYKWEPSRHVTSDGYVLTMFKMWNPEKVDVANKGPILIGHGSGMDGASWLEWNPEPAPHALMVDEGHIVYIGNERGVTWSTGHVEFDAVTD